MKRIICTCSVLCLFNAYSVDNTEEAEPTIYADVSQSAIDNAVSFDGIRGIIGIGIGLQQYNSSITGGSNYTSNDMNVFALTAGLGYAKSFKSNLLIGIDILADLSPKKKKDGDWKSLNSDLDAKAVGDKYGKLNTDMLTPSLGIRVGYAFQEYKTAVFAKFGASMVSGSYVYYQNGAKVADVDVNAIVPTIGLGAEHRFNKQWGVSLEANMPIKRVNKKTAGNAEHKIKVGRTDIRLLGIYNVALGQSNN
jgi:hypothetical protein